MKRITMFIVLIGLVTWTGCSSSSTTGGTETGSTYATFGQTVGGVYPSGLTAGGVNADISLMMKKLSGECASSYTDCPYITASGGGDSDAGEILMRLWALDYNGDCTEALLEDGTCFDCEDCNTGSVGTTEFYKPTMLSSPRACATTSTTVGKYVNFGVDPCFFDTIINEITNIEACETVEGGAVDISLVVPWYSSWGIEQTIKFSAYYSRSSGGIWWTVNNGDAGNEQVFLSLNSNWLYFGQKREASDEFIFFATGSPAYFASEGGGVNIAAYSGPLSTITKRFEVIQVRDQTEKYIERLRVNDTHVWYQKWSESAAPATPDEVEDAKNSPDSNRCLKIGDSVVRSLYVPFEDCVTAFSASSTDNLNSDDNYTLKIIDFRTASSIDFSDALTPTTETSCLEEDE